MAADTRGIAAKSVVPPMDMQQFELACKEYGGLACQDMGEATKVVQIAQAIASIRASLTPSIMAQIMQLQGTRVGFKTDKDRNRDGTKGPGYPVEVVKDVTVEAILYGSRMTGNETNIIAAGCYLTKEHFIRKIRELPGMSDLEITFGVPKIDGDQATVNCRAKWQMNGVPQGIGLEPTDPCNIVVRVYNAQGGGYDQAIGKAEKKLRSRIWARATGSTITLPEGDLEEDRNAKEVTASTVDAPAQSAKVAAVNERLANRKTAPSSYEAAKPAPTTPPPPENVTVTDTLPFERDEPTAEREPGADDDKPEPAAADQPPPSYQRLSRAYESHSALVDQCLRDMGITVTLVELDWRAARQNPDLMAKLARAAARVAKSLEK